MNAARFNLLGFPSFSETGGVCISPKPSEPDAVIIPGMAMRPFFGIKPVLMDAEVRGSSVGGWVGGHNQPTGKGRLVAAVEGATRLRVENPPGYFVAAAASQIVQTVGVM